MIRKFLKTIYVLQEVSNEEREKRGLKKLGRGYFKAYRLNPYNPLSYISFIIIFIAGILMFGFIGIWKEIDNKNPFKWV